MRPPPISLTTPKCTSRQTPEVYQRLTDTLNNLHKVCAEFGIVGRKGKPFTAVLDPVVSSIGSSTYSHSPAMVLQNFAQQHRDYIQWHRQALRYVAPYDNMSHRWKETERRFERFVGQTWPRMVLASPIHATRDIHKAKIERLPPKNYGRADPKNDPISFTIPMAWHRTAYTLTSILRDVHPNRDYIVLAARKVGELSDRTIFEVNLWKRLPNNFFEKTTTPYLALAHAEGVVTNAQTGVKENVPLLGLGSSPTDASTAMDKAVSADMLRRLG